MSEFRRLPNFEVEFVKRLEREIENKVRRPAAQVVADTAEEVFTNILNLWPLDTGWSQANHRINVGRNPARDFPLEPPTRPTEKGALLGEASSNENEQLGKLDEVKFGDSVLIGNAVPYAVDVGFRSNLGIIIYAEAGAIGKALVSSRIG